MNHLYLAHHGIKGQKWGVRRFQNEDGSLTNAGKVRYNLEDHYALSDEMSSKTKAGQTVQLSADPPGRIVKFLAAHNRKIREKQENTRNYTLRANGKQVGDMTLYKESTDSMNVIWVGVDDSERGHGYATAAMIGAIEVARRSGCKQVTLEVPGKSPDARHIYEKLGFREVGTVSTEEDDPYWGGLTAMRLDLSDEKN